MIAQLSGGLGQLGMARWAQAVPSSAWWLAGGINPADCIAAYQPKGAASFSDSLINLANPGTHDAISTGTNNPPLSSDGWVFSGDATVTMHASGVRCNYQRSAFYRIINGSGWTFGNRGDPRFHISVFYQPKYILFGVGDKLYNVAWRSNTGVFGLNGLNCYIDGIMKRTLDMPLKTGLTTQMAIGGDPNYGRGAGTIVAASYYSTTITDAQAIALSAAMAAL